MNLHVFSLDLTSSLAGDFGFDPLGLGEDPGSLKWYVQAELVHCRFAMAGVAGILFTDVGSLFHFFFYLWNYRLMSTWDYFSLHSSH